MAGELAAWVSHSVADRNFAGPGCWVRQPVPLDRGDQAASVITEALVPDDKRVATGQTSQALRQIVVARHNRTLDQDRDDPHITGQGGLDFQPHDVARIIQPPSAPLIGCGQPGRADERQQHLAGPPPPG